MPAILSAKQVVARVKQGNCPPNWKVYQGSGSYGCIIIAAVVLAFFIGLATLMIGTIAIWTTTTLSIIGIPCVVCTIIIIIGIQASKKEERSLLIILPEGVVKYRGGNLKTFYWLQFSDIRKIDLAQETEVCGNEDGISTTNTYWLDVYLRNGRYLKWHAGNEFADTASICKLIIAAYSYYTGR
jgi:hypothetical protein